MTVFSRAKFIENELIEWYELFHMCPEIGMDLPVTSARVKKLLTDWNVDFKEIIPHGLIARIGKKESKTILLRADMDALPIQELTGLPYASKTVGCMHACGHDMHTVMLLGAAKILKESEAELNGSVLLMFQPGEETVTGAKKMVDAGALSNPRPDYAIAMHVSGMPFKTGSVSLIKGEFAASVDNFRVEIQGKGGHGSSPHESTNPIYVAMKIIEMFNDIGRNEIDPQIPSVIHVCSVQAGESAYNVIPDTATFRGTIRFFDESKRADTINRLQDATRVIGTLCHCEAAFHIDVACPSTHNDSDFTDTVFGWLSEGINEMAVENLAMKMMGSEDFSYIAQDIPSSYMILGAGTPEYATYPPHHPKVQFDERALVCGVSVHVTCALSYLK